MSADLGPRRTIRTDRLVLMAACPEHASGVARFNESQREHLEPWSPPMVADLFTEQGQFVRMQDSQRAFDSGAAWRWLLFPPENPDLTIGFVHYSQVVRGVFQNAYLGYAIAKEWEGKGLMFEALTATQEEVFSHRGALHRVQANVVPENARSLALLERLGFEREGLARDYLFIGGAWRDHVMTARINPAFAFDDQR